MHPAVVTLLWYQELEKESRNVSLPCLSTLFNQKALCIYQKNAKCSLKTAHAKRVMCCVSLAAVQLLSREISSNTETVPIALVSILYRDVSRCGTCILTIGPTWTNVTLQKNYT